MAATVTISIEIELGWGVHDLQRYDHLSERGQEERRYLRKLLDACDVHRIPVSFDVVGHLFLEECAGTHSGPYADGWFEADPGTDSDVLCGDVDENTQRRDLEYAQHLHETETDGQTTSLVPPRHYDPSADVLREQGIGIVRVPTGESTATGISRFRELLLGPPHVGEPQIEDGVVETYCTAQPTLTAASLPSGQQASHIAFRWLPVRIRRRLHERYLRTAVDAAIDDDSSLHVWCHLYDLSNEYQFPQIESFLETLASLREDDEVTVKTMSELNDDTRARRASPSKPATNPNGEDERKRETYRGAGQRQEVDQRV